MTRGFMGRRTRLALITATTLVSLGVAVGNASAGTRTFANSTPILIPSSGVATPYPSTIGASGFAGNVQKVTATLHSFSHTCPDDVAVLLVGPGAKSILMGNVGGCSGDPTVLNVTLTFDQSATSVLNADDDAVSGTYRPSINPLGLDSLSPPAPGPPYPGNLDVFNGTPANGTWSLFVDDQFSGDEGMILAGWSLALTAPVNTATTGKPKLNKKKGTARIPVTVADAGQLVLSGKGVKTASASKAVAVGGAGTVNLTVRPKGKTAKTLNSTGKAKVKVKITFTPNGGSPSVTTKKLTLKRS
jgi:hypothetical protein